METQFVDVLRPVLGLVLGCSIGLGFGLLQAVAQRRHRRRQAHGRLKTGWVLVPGSMGRVAYLLIALVLVQVVSPALFSVGEQWWVSAGVALGYGALLGRQVYRRRTENSPIQGAAS